jgi:hypothetical protein
MILSLTVGRLIGDLVTGAAILIIAAGAAVLCVTGPKPFQGRGIRIGLGAIAIGLAGLQASSIVAMTLTYDPLENGPFIILGLGGIFVSAIGFLTAITALLRAGDRSRTVGLLLLAGPVLLFIAGTIAPHATELPLQIVTGGVAVLGALGFVLGGTGLGMLAIRGALVQPVIPS